MNQAVSHAVRHPRRRQPLVWGLLALALLLAQLLGQWHVLAHGQGAGATAHPVVQTHGAAHAHAHGNAHADWSAHAGAATAGQAAPLGWLDLLFSGHHQIDCQLIDQLCAGQAPGSNPPQLAAAPQPSALVALWQALAPTAPFRAGFQARAPPLG
ncbi:MAG: hypothetical protein KA914_03965 [Ottowia sp.]|nr:hypothetical protein [Ottowia sp.]